MPSRNKYVSNIILRKQKYVSSDPNAQAVAVLAGPSLHFSILWTSIHFRVERRIRELPKFRNQLPLLFFLLFHFVELKVHKSKGRTQFVVYVYSSKNKLGRLRNKLHFLQILPVFYLIQPSSKQIICFDFWKQNNVLPIVFYVPWLNSSIPESILPNFFFFVNENFFQFFAINLGRFKEQTIIFSYATNTPA